MDGYIGVTSRDPEILFKYFEFDRNLRDGYVKSGGDLRDGYIGVTVRDISERYHEHAKDDLKDKIKPTTKCIPLLTGLNKVDALICERLLRPVAGIGWNVKRAGAGLLHGRRFTLYHIYDPPKPPGLTERFVKWIFRIGK